MQVEVRLRKVLQDHGLDTHGIQKKISDDCKRARQVIWNLYHNRQQTVRLDILGQICDWLHTKGVPANILPGALFGSGVPSLWEAVAAPGKVTLYLAEHRQSEFDIPSIARRDLSVVTEIVRLLSIPGNAGPAVPELVTEYVPFRVIPARYPAKKREAKLEEAREMAIGPYERMKHSLTHSSAILIGSARVNFLLEMLVADLFDAEAFSLDRKKIRVPFHLAFHPRKRLGIQSCFGSLGNPKGRTEKRYKGTYYLNKSDDWVHCPSVEGKEESGIVITFDEKGTNKLQLAIAGVSGMATEALGLHMTKDSKQFWPPYLESRGRKIGIYVCHFKIARPDKPQASEPARATDMEVFPIAPEVLKKYLVGGPG